MLWTVLPALIVTLLWATAEPIVIRHMVDETLPQSIRSLSPAEQSLTVGRISSVAKGLPSLSREDYEVIKRVRYGFTAPDDALRILQDRGVALGSAPEPFIITAAYDQVEYERWSCTNYVTSIAHEIAEALPGTEARPVRRVADSEGKILDRIGGLMGLIALAALLSAGLTVWSLTATTMMERRGEIAIMQAIGAARWLVASLFTLEVAVIGLAGGLIGSLAGVWLARYVGQSVFHSAVEVSPVLPFVIIGAAIVISIAGAAQPLRRALRMEPAVILREGV